MGVYIYIYVKIDVNDIQVFRFILFYLFLLKEYVYDCALFFLSIKNRYCRMNEYQKYTFALLNMLNMINMIKNEKL